MATDSNHPLVLHRQSHHLTREQLAEQIGCSSRTLARWEKGQYRPRLVFAVRASQVTGIAVQTLCATVPPSVAP
ncbi:MAG: helix-turn-helix transcriptional regulator [Candidatus Zixiibacteriota bacterium]